MVPLGVSLGPRTAQPAPRLAVAGGPGHRPHDAGVLVLDDTGDRKDGTATAHVARQYLGSVGKIDNGIVAVTSLWTDERCCWPVHAVPYTPASRRWPRASAMRVPDQAAARPRADPGRQQAGIGFQAVVADCFYGDDPGFTEALGAAKVRFVLALKPRKAPGRRRRRPILRSRRPVSSAGRVPGSLTSGDASSGASATATPTPGGEPTPDWAAGARIGGCGWWWPPPTRPGCPGTAAGIC
jgi:hypothetical protein